MDHKKKIIIGVIILGILALFIFNGPSNKALSPNILYITQPVTSFSGKVEKIEGIRLTVTQKLTASQNLIPLAVNPLQTTPLPTPKMMTVTYLITLTDKTQISRPPSFINYLFKTAPLVGGAPSLPAGSALNMTVKDIKVGQIITVNTLKDLRTLIGNTFEATMINLPQISNTLSGKIVSIEGSVLIVKGFALNMSPIINPGYAVSTPPQEKEYRVSINSDTEISRNVNPGTLTAPKPEKLSIGDLKKDMQVSVYTAEDVTESQTLTALRIEPAPAPPSTPTSPLIAP